MYKKLLKSIHLNNIKKTNDYNDLYKSIGKPKHSIKDKLPHFIFSAENPIYPENKKLNMTHEQTVEFLKNRGYNVEEIKRKYGKLERSILVHNPPKHAIKSLFKLAGNLGQESSVYSDGYKHELHFHSGPNAGMHHKGEGTAYHKKEPKDFYSTLNDNTHFTHNINFNELHDKSKSLLKPKTSELKKSEEGEQKQKFKYLPENTNKHPLEEATPDTKLIHYSPEENLQELDPSYHGVRRIGSETKQGKPDHPLTFFYLEGTKPESLVTTGVKSKYVANLGGMKLYDVAKDVDNIREKAKKIANERQVNRGVIRRADVDKLIQDHGYSGFYNSALNDTMRNVVGVYKKVPAKGYKIHPQDFHEATSIDHHLNDQKLQNAKKFSEETGFHDYKFLNDLGSKLGKKD